MIIIFIIIEIIFHRENDVIQDGGCITKIVWIYLNIVKKILNIYNIKKVMLQFL